MSIVLLKSASVSKLTELLTAIVILLPMLLLIGALTKILPGASISTLDLSTQCLSAVAFILFL